MLFIKRNMLKLGYFEYEISNTNGIIAKMVREREGKEFRYISQGFENDFELRISRKYVATEPMEGDSRRIGAFYKTFLGFQGSIMHCVKSGSFFLKNIFYWAIEYNDKYYKIYEVGRKKEGTFYCVYVDDVLVAMVRKDAKVVYNSTQYEIFSEKFVPFELLSILTLFIDLARYYPNVENRRTISTEYRRTPQKELKDKYDDTFIPRIKSMEEIAD